MKPYKTLLTMKQTIKYLPTGQTFDNRKEAKIALGHSNFNHALRDGKIVFITTYSPTDIII